MSDSNFKIVSKKTGEIIENASIDFFKQNIVISLGDDYYMEFPLNDFDVFINGCSNVFVN